MLQAVPLEILDLITCEIETCAGGSRGIIEKGSLTIKELNISVLYQYCIISRSHYDGLCYICLVFLYSSRPFCYISIKIVTIISTYTRFFLNVSCLIKSI